MSTAQIKSLYIQPGSLWEQAYIKSFHSGLGASVSGGAENTASGVESSVSGGVFNLAGGTGTVVIGGQNVTNNKDISIAPQPPFP